jgi:hypothetical protein
MNGDDESKDFWYRKVTVRFGGWREREEVRKVR